MSRRKRDVYTLRPLTGEQWAALDPANHYRARIRLDDEGCIHGYWRSSRAEAEADLAELLVPIAKMRERRPGMAQVTSSDVEEREVWPDLPELILDRLTELSDSSDKETDR